MATIRVTKDELSIEMHGMDKFWALRSSLSIPLSHIAGEKIRRVVIEIEGQTAEEAAQAIEAAIRGAR